MLSWGRPRNQSSSFSKNRVDKGTSRTKRSFRDASTASKRVENTSNSTRPQQPQQPQPSLTSAIITLCVGREQRLFAAHEDVLCQASPFFQSLCRGQFFESTQKRIDLPDEEPEIFSSVLEYLYKGDYFPRLVHDRRRQGWSLEDTIGSGYEPTIYHAATGTYLLKDTVIYCTAERYGMEELKRLALRKQGLHSGIQCSTILASARYAYANTPDNDSKLRAHYLALIIRSRHTFKRSGTMQNEMEAGGKLFFDLFVAMVNHM
ncbi:hypothetical protein BDY21DRAFT_284340, partial [Lineolata rhizophorae]